MSDSSGERYVIEARLLGVDESCANKKRQRKSEMEFAIDVTLSDESSYVIFRTVRQITVLHTKVLAQFPVEAGYFNKKEAIIPDCPLKMTIFGPTRIVREDRVFEKLLNSYIKELPGMPKSIVKCELINNFFALRGSDIAEPGTKATRATKPRRKNAPVVVTDDSKITGPMRLRSYYAVADYKDAKTRFSFSEGAVVQVLQKDSSGWWMIDVSGSLGWAPASFLVPVDEGDLADEAKENEKLLSSMRVGARYISVSAYQASRDDEVSFVKGAIVRLIKKYADGWWLVRYNGGEGYVPGSMFRKFDRRQGTAYVKNIRRKFHNRKSTKIIPTMKPKWMSDPASAPASGLMLYQCLTRYKGSDSSEISLNKNDMVKVLDKKDHGWWYVEDRHGRTGWAPATYLGPVVDRARKASSSSKSSIIGSTHDVREPYTAQQKDELTVARGDKVTVLSAPDDGWWVVCNMSSMEQGLIPSVCLNEATSALSEGDKPSAEALETMNELSKALEEQEDELEDGEEEEEEEEEAGQNISESGTGSDDDDDIMLDSDQYVAVTNYTRQAQDELSVIEGQVVYVVDDSDRNMYYVVVDGKEGWVPSDILRLTAASRRSSVSSSVSSRRSRSPSPARHSRSVSPSPMNSRSPSPMDMSEFDSKPQRPFPHQNSNPATPQRAFLRPSPRARAAATRTKSLDTTDGKDQSKKEPRKTSVQIHVEHTAVVEEGASVEDIEQAALEAERMAQEAQRRAAELREKLQRARRSITPKEDSD